MATKKSPKPTLPLTLQDVAEELSKQLDELSNFSRALQKDIEESLSKKFYAAGGCKKCRGRGWVVTWDTMDYMDGSAADFGGCPDPECTDVTRAASGLHPSRSKYDYNRGVDDVVVNSDAYRAIVGPVNAQINEVRSAFYDIERQRRAFKKGDRVVVARGRKVPFGTIGRVAWISRNTGGILLKDEDKWQDRATDGVWVDPRNLEIIVED
jgi:hypothetical protein